MELSYACLGPMHSIYSYYECRVSDIAAVGITFNIFSYDAVWAEYCTHQLPNAGRMRYQNYATDAGFDTYVALAILIYRFLK